MKRLDIKSERKKWDHPYRIQVSNPLAWGEMLDFIEQNAGVFTQYAIEKRDNKFVLWREPEQGWDVDQASHDWIEEWTSHKPPPLTALIEKSEVKPKYGDEDNMSIGENRMRRDNAIRTEFKYFKDQGFKTGHIYRVLAEKYFLSSARIRDIVTSVKERTPKATKHQ